MERPQQPSSGVGGEAERGALFGSPAESAETQRYDRGDGSLLIEALSVEMMDAHRNRQFEVYEQLMRDLPVDTSEYRIAQALFELRDIPAINREYLHAQGVSESHPGYEEASSMLDRYSIRSSLGRAVGQENGWRFGPIDAEGRPLPSGRELYQQEWQMRFGQQSRNAQAESAAAPAPDSTQPMVFDELEELKHLVEQARQEADTAYAERMKAGPLEGKKQLRAIRGAFDERHQALQQHEATFDEKFIGLMRQGGATEAQIAQVVARGAKERNDRNAKSQQEAMIGKGIGGMARRGLRRYERLRTPEKVAVGLGAAALIGGIGVLTGGVLTMAGAAGVAAARGYRTYALQRAKLYKDTGPTRGVAYQNERGDIRTPQQILEESRLKERERVAARFAEGDKVKKRALGLGAAALGLTGVGVVAEHQDGLQRLAINGRILWSRVFDGVWPFGSVPHIPDLPNLPDVNIDTDPTPDVEGRLPERAPRLPGMEHVSEAAYEIRSGEGWYETFSQMGVNSPDAREALLRDGSLMRELRAAGLAYEDPTIGGWGINQQADRQMPQAAIEAVVRAASRLGIALA